MNKYARIDKYCKKAWVYYCLYYRHQNTPGMIARKFGVKTQTVVRAIKSCDKYIAVMGTIPAQYHTARQLAWSYYS